MKPTYLTALSVSSASSPVLYRIAPTVGFTRNPFYFLSEENNFIELGCFFFIGVKTGIGRPHGSRSPE